jgi:hypothetical protein
MQARQCAIVALACQVTAWAQMLALTGHEARRWGPKRLRLQLLSIPAGSSGRDGGPCCTYPGTPPGPDSCCRRSTGSASPRPRAPG